MKRGTTLVKIAGQVSIALLLSLMAVDLEAQGALDGKWQTGEDNSVVEVTEAGGVAVGKLVSSDNPNAVMGTEILRNVTKTGDVWSGKIWAAKRKKLMDATITPSADTLEIKVSAGIASRTVTWARVKP